MNVKISVSLPGRLLERLDAARDAHGIGRSAAVQRAVEQWTRGGEPLDLDYVEAYRRVPEPAAEIDAWGAAAAEAWTAKPPKRRRRAAR
jgi:hypothetical protein